MDNKELTPKIRFAGFTDPWEQRKLGELSERVIVGLATSVTPYYRNEGTPILRNLNIKENYLDDSDILFLDDEYADGQTGKKIHTGDVLTVHTGYIGTSCIVPEKYDGCLPFTTLITTTNSTKLNGEFLSQYLNSEMGLSAVQMVTTQGGRQNLNTNDFVNVLIPHPSIDEQKKICDILRYFDNLITLHQRKYEKLQNIKKSMLEKMFPRDGSNIPEVRFAGFTDPWEQRKFSEVFVGLQNNTLSRADLNYDQGDIKNVHYGDVLIKFGEYIDVTSAELPYINDSSIESKFAKSLLTDGDIIIADTAEDETVGKCCEITNSDSVKLLSGLHTIAVRPQQKYAPKFLGYYLNSSAYHSQLIPLMQGIKVTSISKGALQDTVLTVPTSIDEQGKLGEYLYNIDNLITLHQRRYFQHLYNQNWFIGGSFIPFLGGKTC